MSLQNTSDRYNYIYGNTVRTLEMPVSEPESVRPKRKVSGRNYPSEKTILDSPSKPAKQARQRRKEEHAIDFDWKYTVIATTAAFVFMLCSIFYVKGTVHLHNLSTQVVELKEEKSKLLGKQTALQSEIDKSTNLDDIRAYALKKLGMVYPKQDHIIYYTDNYSDYIRQYESVNVSK